MKNRLVTLLITLSLLVNLSIVAKDKSIASADLDKSATTPDYGFMHTIIEDLTHFIFSVNAKDNGLYKGRNFATYGERYVAINLIKQWLIRNSNNLDHEIIQEKIGDNSYGPNNKMTKANNNIEILDYGLSFRNATSGASNAIIPLNETYPFPSYNQLQDPAIMQNYTVGTDDNYYKVTFDSEELSNIINQFNVSFDIINESNNLIEGEVTYIQNYSNATIFQTEGKIHLINVTDEEFNTLIFITNYWEPF